MGNLAGNDGENTGLIILISLVATIGGFLFGFDSGVINGTVDGLERAFHSNSIGTGFNVASMLLGCAAGAFFAGRLADLYGRRMVLIVAAVCFVVSGWGSGIASGAKSSTSISRRSSQMRTKNRAAPIFSLGRAP